jgi:hypothetical protein
MISPTAVTLSVEMSSLAATPAVLVSEEMSTLPPTLAATPTDLPTPTEIHMDPPTLTAIPMARPTLVETTSLPPMTTTVPATLEALDSDQAETTTALDTTTNLLVSLLAMTS